MQKKKLKKAAELVYLEPQTSAQDKELNDIPSEYLYAEVLSVVPGFPYQLVEFTLVDRTSVKTTVHENIVNNLQRVIADEG